MKTLYISSLVIGGCLVLGGAVRGTESSEAALQNWPEWRGPLQTGVAPTANPPVRWSESENVKWKVAIPGSGSSTPIVWNDRVFVLTAIPVEEAPEGESAAASPQDAGSGSAPQRRRDAVQRGADDRSQVGRQRGRARSESDAQADRPRRDSQERRRGPGRAGGRGGPGGFGPGNLLAPRMMAAGDQNDDERLSREEMRDLANAWWAELDPTQSGTLDEESFSERFGELLGSEPGERRRGPPGRIIRRMVAPGFFSAVDANDDDTVTQTEFREALDGWFADWEANEADGAGLVDTEQLAVGLNAALPRPEFRRGPQRGAPDSPRRRGGRRGGFGGDAPSEPYRFVVLCLDRNTGEVLWQQTAREEVPHQGHHREGSFASCSPVTDGEHVFAYFGSRGLHSYDMDGNHQWSRDFGEMRIRNGFGEGTSPALYGDTLVIKWDHEGDSFIEAIDKNTGETRWKTPREEGTSWSSPLIVAANGRAEVVTTATERVRSYDLATGEPVWEAPGLTANAIPTPVSGHGIVYAMSGFRGANLQAIQLGHTGDLSGSDAIVWTHDRATPYVPSPLLYEENLYFFSGNRSILSSFNATTGEARFSEERINGLSEVYASPVGAAGRVYLTGRDGNVVVIKSSDELETLATNELDDRIDASPAIAGNEIFLRGHDHLYCIGR